MMGIRNYYYPLLLLVLLAISASIYFFLPLIMEHFAIAVFLAVATLSIWMALICWSEYRRREASGLSEKESQK